MLIPLGTSQEEAASMSTTMLSLAADMGSFNDQDPTEMLERLRSGLAGESEPLRQFGAFISEARVQQFAWSEGIAENGVALTEQQKVMARYGLILQDTAAQQGDFTRTADVRGERPTDRGGHGGGLRRLVGRIVPACLRAGRRRRSRRSPGRSRPSRHRCRPPGSCSPGTPRSRVR